MKLSKLQHPRNKPLILLTYKGDAHKLVLCYASICEYMSLLVTGIASFLGREGSCDKLHIKKSSTKKTAAKFTWF